MMAVIGSCAQCQGQGVVGWSVLIMITLFGTRTRAVVASRQSREAIAVERAHT